jgi:SAM-dependent methyltransferase/CBS domain-containing protein
MLLRMNLTARDIMTPLSECVRDEDTVLEASRRLLELQFAATPIVSADVQVRGSLKNVHVVKTIAQGADPAQTRVADVSEFKDGEFRPTDVSVPADHSVDETSRTMTDQNVTHVLVKEGDDLIGVVAPADIQSYTYTAPDGLPFPSPELIRLIMGPNAPRRWLWKQFYESGARTADDFRQVLTANGADLSDFKAILDFGCGCGRVLRHWRDLDTARLHGSDYNPALVEWCRRNMPFADFEVNDAAPGLAVEDDTFDLVYVFSVFTHLDIGLQQPWIDELRRVTKPNGHLLVTVMGESHLGALDDKQRERFEAGKPVVSRPEASGTNSCAVFHPDQCVRSMFARELDLVAYLPAIESLAKMDVVLLRKGST